jgi:hypothetical protein
LPLAAALEELGVGPDACPSSSPSSGYSKRIGTTGICQGQELALVLYLCEALDVVLVIYLRRAFEFQYHPLEGLMHPCENLMFRPSD